MNLTKEQTQIINSTGNIKINAVAGSGKTTTLIQYALSRPKNSKILYLVFNSSAKEEAKTKFSAAGLNNVKIHTAHTLALHYFRRKGKYRENNFQDYKPHDLVKILHINNISSEKNSAYVLAYHIRSFVSVFCSQSTKTVKELNYRDFISNEDTKKFVETHYQQIEDYTRKFLGKLKKSEIQVTHEFYLKEFQLENPILPYDYILFDEGQDASPVMLDIFLKQKAIKVIVGDTNQQIYRWRYAINALQQVDFKEHELNTSFRLNEKNAEIATKCLNWKMHLGEFKSVQINGINKSKELKSRVFLARTNLGLLKEAIWQTEINNVQRIYFEGNINTYYYATEGTSLFDVLNLYLHNNEKIKNETIKQMISFDELIEYGKRIGDFELKTLIDLVREYKTRLPSIISSLKNKHVEDKESAEIIFSTVHKAKGIEYDEVTLADDFIDEETIVQSLEDKNCNIEKLDEEINILYVAITRSKNKLIFSKKQSSERQVFNPPRSHSIKRNHQQIKPKSSSNDEKKDAFPNSSKAWTIEEDNILREKYWMGIPTKIICEQLGRKEDEIYDRIFNVLVKLKPSEQNNSSNIEKKVKYPNSNKKWNEEDDKLLEELHWKSISMSQICDQLGREATAIETRLAKLNIREKRKLNPLENRQNYNWND